MNFRLILVDIGLRWFMSTTVNQNNFCPLSLGSTFALGWPTKENKNFYSLLKI